MASRKSSGEPKQVTLLDPDGNEYHSQSPAEMNQLHYGRGYSFKDHDSFREAVEYLGDDAAVPTVVRGGAEVGTAGTSASTSGSSSASTSGSSGS